MASPTAITSNLADPQEKKKKKLASIRPLRLLRFDEGDMLLICAGILPGKVLRSSTWRGGVDGKERKC